MLFKQTIAVKKILSLRKKIKILQGGSCFAAGTPVMLANGKTVPIEQIGRGDSVLSLSSNHEIIGSEVYDLWENAPNKPIISFRVGKETIRATYDHKFYTPEGYKELYRIVWGDLDSSQRLQLELLCEQHGATFDLDPSWRQESRDNEASDNGEGKQTEEVPNTEDRSRRENNLRSSGGSESVDTESIEPTTDRPPERGQLGQPGRELGVGDTGREYAPSIQNRSDEAQARGVERKVPTQRPTSSGDAFRVGHNTSVQSEGVSQEIWGLGGLHKGHIGTTQLRSFTPEQIQIQQPEKTFAISVREENYFVGESGINVSNSAGKTIAVLLIFISLAQRECENCTFLKKDHTPTCPCKRFVPAKVRLYSVVSETLPHLKKGAIRDFLNIMEGHGYYKDANWNRTDYIYTFETGSKIEFFSADSPDKVRGPRRNVLFINEANNISYETYTQLSIRTDEEIYIDYNPVSEFWVHEEVMPNEDHDFLILTYKDNDALPEEVVKRLESRMNKPGWWKVYGEGQLGAAEGVIYPRWPQIDEIPAGARLERYGLDFGYSNDPTALVAVWYYDQGYILDEILFKKGVSNREIADTITAQEHSALVIADAAEPKSIDDIRGYGINIIPATKGQGSVLQGIQIVQDQNIRVTKRSTNLIKANKNYVWDTDIDGKPTNKPDHFWSDLMDATRYALASIATLKARKEFAQRMPRRQQKPRVNPAR